MTLPCLAPSTSRWRAAPDDQQLDRPHRREAVDQRGRLLIAGYAAKRLLASLSPRDRRESGIAVPRSRTPTTAFLVDVSEQLNTPTVIFAGKLIARVGLATDKPAELIVPRISQDTRALEAELAAAEG